MKASIAGRLRNTILPKSKHLLPVFEAVMNSFQAIEEAGPSSSHSIRVEIIRQPTLAGTGPGLIDTFIVTDTGIGFNDDNCESFETVDSEHKINRGGKGLGRFLWLKAFARVEIESHFADQYKKPLLKRQFGFEKTGNDATRPTLSATQDRSGTIVKLIGYQSPYREDCPRKLDVIALRFVGHFLPLLVNPEGPNFILCDESDEIDLRSFFRDNEQLATTHKFNVAGEPFTMMGFRLSGSISDHHEIMFGADYREVQTERLSRHIPNLKNKLTDPDRGQFSYLAFVQGPYLDSHVTSDRTNFSIPKDPPAPDDLLAGQLDISSIRNACLDIVKSDLRTHLDDMNASKDARLVTFVTEEAPEYRFLLRHKAEFIDQIPPGATNAELDAFLRRQVYQRQNSLREKGARLLTEAADTENYDTLLKAYINEENELGKSALARYVTHRRVILDLLDRAISVNSDTGKYPLEKAVHRLVFPMQATSDDVPSEQQNLWVIDERLAFHSFLSSDKALSTTPALDTNSATRPDILIFNTPILFGDGSVPLTTMIVVEFKRPDRTSYPSETPLAQVFRIVREVRDGVRKDSKGKTIRAASKDIPAYCYVVCDLTEKLETILQDASAIRTPDNLGYYGFNTALNAYYEVISYPKLLADARKRNRVLFEKLNLPTT